MKQPGDRKTSRDEEYNWKEDLTASHTEDMISSKDLSSAINPY
jgi:hypothetical protein